MDKGSDETTQHMAQLLAQVKRLCQANNCDRLFLHLCDVAKEAKALASRCGINEDQAYMAGLLHDIGGIFPNDQRIAKAKAFHIPLFKEEIALPMIIHQKLSKVLAEQHFLISDEAILLAISCHTTLKADASVLDKVVFIADKIQWDGEGEPPYLSGLLDALDTSLSDACLYYILYLLAHDIKVLHPWLIEAKLSLEAELI